MLREVKTFTHGHKVNKRQSKVQTQANSKHTKSLSQRFRLPGIHVHPSPG